jgi:hypothetical protein
MIGFGSYRSASTASPALASIVAEVTLHPSKGLFCQENPRNLPRGRRNATGGQLPSCFGQTNPTERSIALAAESAGAARTHQPNEPNGQQ